MTAAPRVLVFGKNGQVGSELVSRICELEIFEVVAVSSEELDLRQTDTINSFISKIEPQWLINAAAYTAVDQAESAEDDAYRLNADAPEAMARYCARHDCRLIHYSTDYVFDGTATDPYLESDTTNPQSVYGRSKREGEERVLAVLPEAIIFRTAWIYSSTGKNFVNTMLRLAQQRTEIGVVSDQLGSPTLAADIADMTASLVEGISSGSLRYSGGIYHSTNRGYTSWYEFCLEIFRLNGIQDVEVKAIETSQFPTAATRPAYSVLCNDKLAEIYQYQMPEWKEALSRCQSSP